MPRKKRNTKNGKRCRHAEPIEFLLLYEKDLRACLFSRMKPAYFEGVDNIEKEKGDNDDMIFRFHFTGPGCLPVEIILDKSPVDEIERIKPKLPFHDCGRPVHDVGPLIVTQKDIGRPLEIAMDQPPTMNLFQQLP